MKNVTIVSPAQGKLIELSKVPDAAFASGAMAEELLSRIQKERFILQLMARLPYFLRQSTLLVSRQMMA